MEKRLLLGVVVLVLGVGGCGDPEDGADAGPSDGASPDLPLVLDMGQPLDQAMPDMGRDLGPVCTCAGVSICCDGCLPRNALAWCHASGDQYGRCGSTGGCNLGAPGAPVTCAADACHSVDESMLPSCVLVPANDGGACDDGNATTFGDVCDDQGGCAGTVCTSSPPCILRSWNGSACVDAVQTGESCDDGNVSTHTDECQANGSCAGTPCECTSGPCCDGCFFRGTGHVCEAGRVVATACSEGTGPSCGLRSVSAQLADVYCAGDASACNGAVVTRPQPVTTACGTGTGCFVLNATPTGAMCVACM